MKYSFYSAGAPLDYVEALRLLPNSAPFRDLLIATLAAVPFKAFRWETPALTRSASKRAFEFVALDSSGLDRAPEPHAFAEHFEDRDSKASVVAFPNLGNDAVLIVPAEVGDASAYVHLATFTRHAPPAQQHELWSLVGRTMEQRLGAAPIWLSTAGAGVAWLHVRIDNRPKYYGYAPYREVNRDL